MIGLGGQEILLLGMLCLLPVAIGAIMVVRHFAKKKPPESPEEEGW